MPGAVARNRHNFAVVDGRPDLYTHAEQPQWRKLAAGSVPVARVLKGCHVPVDQVSYLVPAVGWVVQGPEYPGRVLADLAVMIADGGDALTHLAVLRDQGKLFGPVASEPTAWRAVERVDEGTWGRLRAVRAAARERAWAAGA